MVTFGTNRPTIAAWYPAHIAAIANRLMGHQAGPFLVFNWSEFKPFQTSAVARVDRRPLLHPSPAVASPPAAPSRDSPAQCGILNLKSNDGTDEHSCSAKAKSDGRAKHTTPHGHASDLMRQTTLMLQKTGCEKPFHCVSLAVPKSFPPFAAKAPQESIILSQHLFKFSSSAICWLRRV